ncbi:beta-galactosidase [Synchytrium microbalum]|uniref:Beta-galactosidase n=1 Tax=Synchytrium microbalum TaxID=1806994 RepID=A0A507BZT0_9FUNG|nr:beta-galactosidase [Synchytrium microbalum]TPX30773.1 beta-galactosidase [Synchytrium microbalum]
MSTWTKTIAASPLAMAGISILTTSAISALMAAWSYRSLRQYNMGSLPITTSSTQYNKEKYGRYFNWDKYSFYVNGQRVVLCSAEFHYWRVPDQSRWEAILKEYKVAGFNCIRIYFHWGFHSPNEGVYVFDGNRDMDFLMQLCQKLEIFVLAAPGPYICAETQGGGFPIWLLAKKNIRLRHKVNYWYSKYDPEFSKYENEWFGALLPILSQYQITNGKGGCLLALQVENELDEDLKGFPIGLHDHMRNLSFTARNLGITVPLFTNAAIISDSFITRPDSETRYGKPQFGVDLYGFDRYLVWVPTGGLLVLKNDRDVVTNTWKPWDPAIIEGGLDGIESTVRSYGGGAAQSPILIPELQGGWFNHWTCPYTYDAIYSYYGHTYTRTLYDSCVAQGSTATSFYMGYGGTNWGTLGDTDVYTSYDYSACIREYGVLSGRGRLLRLSSIFMRSFTQLAAATDLVLPGKSYADIIITASPTKVLAARRSSKEVTGAGIAIFRNFSKEESSSYNVSIQIGKLPAFQLRGLLPYKSSFISLVNYTANNGLNLVASTMPIHLRTYLDVLALGSSKIEVLVVQNDDNASGELAFRGHVTVQGTLAATTRSELEGAVTVVRFEKQAGWASVTPATSATSIYIVALATHDLFTLAPVFDESHFRKDTNTSKDNYSPTLAAWGCTHISRDHVTGNIDIQYSSNDTGVYVLSGKPVTGFQQPVASDPYANIPFILQRSLGPISANLFARPVLTNWTHRPVDFESMAWHPLPFHKDGKPTLDTLDLGYTSAHCLYRARFTVPRNSGHVKLSINARHRVTIYVNDVCVGGHFTYSLALMQPGAKQGADWEMFASGRREYDLSGFVEVGVNSVVVLVDSVGFQRGPSFLYDFRNQRGIVQAKITGAKSISWDVTGIDVKTLSNAYTSTGFPDESATTHYTPAHNIKQEGQGPSSTTSIITLAAKAFTPRYYISHFDAPTASASSPFRVPLRLCISGSATAYIFLNGVLIGRYFGEGGDCAQKDFYMHEGFVRVEGNEVKMLVYSRETAGDVVIKVEVREWRTDSGGGLEERFSFNLVEDGAPVIFGRERLPS